MLEITVQKTLTKEFDVVFAMRQTDIYFILLIDLIVNNLMLALHV